MPGALSFLYGSYFIISAMVLSLCNLVIAGLTWPFDPNRRLIHALSCRWAYHHVLINPLWKVRFVDTEQIDPAKTYVLVANHQSYADILILYGLNKPFKWVSKESVFKVPGIGWNMFINQYVRIKRGDLKSTKEMMQCCKDWLLKDVSIMMFPEGTRSETGELQNFKHGPFRLAVECNVPIIPIVLDGTFPILPKGAKYLNFQGDITAKVLAPVHPSDFDMDSERLLRRVHDDMKNALAELRAEAEHQDELLLA